ncbi:MAG TPA: hypothetical protein DIC60_00470, partial [Lachnospiraceae bacterium]|nr:hypothetical protein [Lachnospiraceae bacterium]
VEGSLHIGNSYWITQKSFDETKGLQPFRPIEVIPETVGQYTELYDNATSDGICEHDIVKFEYDGEEIIGTIKYERGLYIVVNNKLPDGYIWLNDLYECDEWCNCEVIGNTHDNPELMEG